MGLETGESIQGEQLDCHGDVCPHLELLKANIPMCITDTIVSLIQG